MNNATKTQIRNFIIENFLFGDASQIVADDASMLEADLIDSTAVLELVAFVEERFRVTLADADIVPANLDTIDGIANLIAVRTAPASMAS